MHAHIDFETRSVVDLKTRGIGPYIEHPHTAPWCLAWAIGKTEPQVWTLGEALPDELRRHVQGGGTVIAHNCAGFELPFWNGVCVPRLGWPELTPEQCLDTMAMAYAMGLPGSLDGCAKALGLPYEKDMAGHRLMLQMCRPRRIEPDGTLIWWDDEDRRRRLYDYCRQDVVVERALLHKLFQLTPPERRLWTVDYRINARGIPVDREAIQAALRVVEEEKARLNKAIKAVTGGAVSSGNQHAALTAWVRAQGVVTAGVAKADVAALLGADDTPEAVREALEARKEAAKASTAKLQAMLATASQDGRVRFTMQYHGAATGRWAGRKIQPHNMPRPKLKQHAVEGVFRLLAKPNAAPLIALGYGPPMTVVSDCLRGMIRAEPGHDFIAADFSAIEARGLAWLAGEERVLEIFRGHGKIYEHAAAGIYGKPMADVTKDERQIGKVAVLALGYQGGVGAFQTMARGYGVQVSDERAEEIKTAWRKVHPAIVRYWYDLEEAAVSAVLRPGEPFSAGATGREVTFKRRGAFFWCRLPSGRALCYPYPRIQSKTTPWGAPKDQVHYMAVNGVTRKWELSHVYGGLLSENVTQAVCRDLLAEAILRLEERGYPVVFHVHDEVVTEAPLGHGSLEEMEAIMSEVPAWAAGFPIKAEGWRGERFRK